MEDKIFFDIQFKKGLDMVVEETMNFDRIIKGVYGLTAREVYGSVQTPGVAVFAYGSPGRIELIGGDSDADVFLAEKRRTKQSERFRQLLNQRWGNFDFSKVDLPAFGTYEEMDVYLSKSLIEGSQVLETRFLMGDEMVRQEIESKKKEFNPIERALKNMVFNRFYLNQYFRQRVREGAPNIKYCSGGSRDFLFVSWYDQLDRMIEGDLEEFSYQPKVKIGLQRLLKQGKITERVLEETLEAINFSICFRSDVLKINKSTIDRGLTFLDDPTLRRLQTLGYPSPSITRRTFEKYRRSIQGISKIIWDETTRKIGVIKGLGWEKFFRQAYSPETPELVREVIVSDDPLMGIALIWGASESGQKKLFDFLVEKYMMTEDWTLIGSIVSSPLASSEVLHHFGTGQLKETGYGYLLRVVARNKNVKRETLESITEDPHLEKRYKEVAQVALEVGNKMANNQI